MKSRGGHLYIQPLKKVGPKSILHFWVKLKVDFNRKVPVKQIEPKLYDDVIRDDACGYDVIGDHVTRHRLKN